MGLEFDLIKKYPWLPSLKKHYPDLALIEPVDFIKDIFSKYNDRFMAAIHRDTAGIEIANLNGGKSWYLDLAQRKIDYNYEYYDKHQMALFKTIRDYAVKRKDMSKLLSALSL